MHCPVVLPTGEFFRELVIPRGIRAIGAYSCRSVASVQIPDTVTSIGEGAFAGSGLTEVVIPDSVTSIGENAFVNCPGLSGVVLPASVTHIADNAFEGCQTVAFTVFRNSYAAQWCITNNYPYTYADANAWLLE